MGSNRLLLAMAAGAMVIGACPAFAGENQNPNIHRDAARETPSGREALNEGVTKLVVSAAFDNSPNRQFTQPEILGLLLLVSAQPASGSSAP